MDKLESQQALEELHDDLLSGNAKVRIYDPTMMRDVESQLDERYVMTACALFIGEAIREVAEAIRRAA